MKYTAINIGPILPTFSMARKPRELWAASYMFSYLMNCIIDKFEPEQIVSPAKLSADADKTVGLYPDRLFVKGEVEAKLLEDAFEKFAEDIKLDGKKTRSYFNLMSVTVEVKEGSEEEKEILTHLNRLLDRMELCNLNVDEKARVTVQNYLSQGMYWLKKVTGKEFKNPSIENIASINIFDDGQEETNVGDRSDKYICIVQADGDSMGKVVANFPVEMVAFLSRELLTFGQNACRTIRDYGGLPIYAGGDDLLFLAPVLTSKGSIFDLIKLLDGHYEAVQKYVKDYQVNHSQQGVISTSMSYGISMTYQKYPLYEALAAAGNALFEVAKKVTGKNAVAWTLQKHSGSTHKVALSKNMDGLYKALVQVIQATESEQLVSAVAHKIFHNEVLLSLWLNETDDAIVKHRLDHFFEKIVDVESKSQSALAYMESVKKLMLEVYKVADDLLKKEDEETDPENETVTLTDEDMKKDRLEKMRELTKIIYGMLRTAKFVKGKEEER